MLDFPNFPQTIDPVSSETILEQFLELNNNFEQINNGYNEIVPQVETNTEDIEILKTQVSESGTRVSVNGVLQAEWSPDEITEDVEQLRLAQSSDSLAIVGLQSDNITNKSDISALQGDVTSLNQTMQRTLKVPLSYPLEIELVGVDDNGSQIMVQIDSILSTNSENPVKNNAIAYELESIKNTLNTKSQIVELWSGSVIVGNTIQIDNSKYKFYILEFYIYGSIMHCLIDSINTNQVCLIYSSKSDTGIWTARVIMDIVTNGINYKSLSYQYNSAPDVNNHSSCTLRKIVGVK